jgi:protein SCO1/2
MKRFRSVSGWIAVALAAQLLTTSCGRRGPEQRYELKGKVVFVDKRGGTVSVAHDAIPGYMDAMTMPYTLKDPRLLNDIAEGDAIQATLVVAGTRSWLEDVITTRTTSVPSGSAGATPSPGPVAGTDVPDFSLTNQSGGSIKLSRFRGSAVVVTFIYTRCPLPDYCPLMSSNFADIAKELKDHAATYPETRLLSITVDPAYDSPKVLKEYGASLGADFGRWEFATGSKDEIKKVASYFGMTYWGDGDQIVHSLRTAVIGPDGKLVKLFTGNEWKPGQVLGELRELK